MQNILFIFAHPDDEAFGPAGTIAKLSKNNHVHVASMCRGNTPTRPEVSSVRIDAFHQSCKILGAQSYIFDGQDLHLDYHSAMKNVTKLLQEIKPETVYTLCKNDVHLDHRLISEVVMVACRPAPHCTVKKLYHCELPTRAWSFGQFEPEFIPNTFVNVDDYMDVKSTVMNLYSTEIQQAPDLRSVDAMKILAAYRGFQSGCYHAEAFNLIYSRD